MLREAARVLADELDSASSSSTPRTRLPGTAHSSPGDRPRAPHAGAHARQQHAVMIEAVENHMPQVIVIDEIGTD